MLVLNLKGCYFIYFREKAVKSTKYHGATRKNAQNDEKYTQNDENLYYSSRTPSSFLQERHQEPRRSQVRRQALDGRQAYIFSWEI